MRKPEDFPPRIMALGIKYLAEDWYLTPVDWDDQREWEISMANQWIESLSGEHTDFYVDFPWDEEPVLVQANDPNLSEEDRKAKIEKHELVISDCQDLRAFMRTLPEWNGGWPVGPGTGVG